MKEALRLSWQPELRSSSLIIGWSVDASALGAKVADYLNIKLGGQSFGEIEPAEFFPLGGVSIEDDLFSSRKVNFMPSPKITWWCLEVPHPATNGTNF